MEASFSSVTACPLPPPFVLSSFLSIRSGEPDGHGGRSLSGDTRRHQWSDHRVRRVERVESGNRAEMSEVEWINICGRGFIN